MKKKKKKIKQNKNDQKIGFSRKRIYRKMWVSREIEIPEWEEVPSLRDRNNVYYIEYYIESVEPGAREKFGKGLKIEGLVYTEKKNMTWILSVKLRKCHCLLGGSYDFLGDTCIPYCFFKQDSNFKPFIQLKYYACWVN